MSVKRSLHPLQDTEVVSTDQAAQLQRYSISTLEELLAALNTERAGIGSLLSLDDGELDHLKESVEKVLPEATVSKYNTPVDDDMRRGYGARTDPPPA